MTSVVIPEFLTPLRIEYFGKKTLLGRGQRRLLEPLVLRSAVLNALITAPCGFVTDLTSVPRLPVAFLVAGDTAHAGSVIHDLLYQTHATERALADAVFLEAMTAEDDPAQEWRRKAMAMMVRKFGGRHWDSGPARFRTLNADLAGCTAALVIAPLGRAQ